MKINIDLVKTGTVVTDVASVFVLVATSNINVDDLNVSRGRWNALSPRVSINVNIRKNHSTNKCGPAYRRVHIRHSGQGRQGRDAGVLVAVSIDHPNQAWMIWSWDCMIWGNSGLSRLSGANPDAGRPFPGPFWDVKALKNPPPTPGLNSSLKNTPQIQKCNFSPSPSMSANAGAVYVALKSISANGPGRASQSLR